MFILIIFVLITIISLLGAAVNRMRKKRMRNALGREINDSEMTSLNSWMAVSEAEDRQRIANNKTV
jgi:hypothetical protein